MKISPIGKWFFICISAVQLASCGAIQYAIKIEEAEQVFEQLDIVGAEQRAPYEYSYAKEYLKKAKEEAASSSYEEAIHFAEVAEKFGHIAIKTARQNRMDEGQ